MNKAGWSSIMVAAMLLAVCLSAEAQQPAKIPRIGFLSPGGFPGNDFRYNAFQQGRRDLGYVVGKNIAIEDRNAEGNLDRLPTLASELVSVKLDIIVTSTTPPIQAVKQATKTIPIVTISADPVGLDWSPALRGQEAISPVFSSLAR